MKYLVNIDMSGNEIQNVVLQPLATAPSGPTIGRIYYDTADHCLKTYNGTGWDPAGAVFSVNSQTGAVTLTKSDVGLGNVDNKSESTIKSDFTGSVADGDTGFVTGDMVYDAISGVISQIPAAYTSNPAMDGTASAGSSTSWAKGDHVHPTDTSRMAASLKGAANGVAELDSNGKVPASQLPSYVDDVIEGLLISSTRFDEQTYDEDDQEWIGMGQVTPETGKIYVARDTGKTYRWSGTAFVEISASLALGETSSTAYRGDRGKTAYDHSQLTSGNPHNVSKSDVGLGNVDNKSEATIRSDFTASSIGPTVTNKFPTADMVWTALQNKLVGVATGTISTSSTSATVSASGTIINAYATMNGSVCMTEISVNASTNAVTFSVASNPSSAITCTVVYIASLPSGAGDPVEL